MTVNMSVNLSVNMDVKIGFWSEPQEGVRHAPKEFREAAVGVSSRMGFY